MITLSNSPLAEDAGAMARVPALPKFRVGEAPERNASAVVVLMVNDVSALPAKGKARIMPQVAAINDLCFMVFDFVVGFRVSFVKGCYREKERPRPIGLAAKFEQKIPHLVGKQEVGQRPCSDVIGLRELLGIGFHDDERTPHDRVAFDQ